jgi:hypothetical protein
MSRRRIFGTVETGMLDNYDEPNQTTSTNGKPMDSKESGKKPQRIADLFFESSEILRKELYDQYRECRKPIELISIYGILGLQ